MCEASTSHQSFSLRDLILSRSCHHLRLSLVSGEGAPSLRPGQLKRDAGTLLNGTLLNGDWDRWVAQGGLEALGPE